MSKVKNIKGYQTALILAAVYFIAMLDRQVIAVLFEPIKKEFGLSDSQLAMVSGLSFALFYTAAGIPLGRLADKTNRVNMLTICLGLWSIATIATGLAGNFFQLLLARIAVGIGEGGCNPAAHSIIADSYTTEKRTSAIGVYMAGGTLGAAAAYLFGAIMLDYFGWRIAVISVGIPGLALMLFLKYALKEPDRPASPAASNQANASMVIVLAELIKNRVYLTAVLANILVTGYLFVVATWLPSYVARGYELSYTQIGLFLSGSSIIGSGCGAVVSGWVTDKMFKRDARWLAGMPVFYMLLGGPIAYIAFSSSNLTILFICIALLKGVLVGSQVPTFSMVHYVVPARMRGVAIASIIMATTVVAAGFFPVVVGLISDLLRESYGSDSLRLGLLGFAVLCPVAMIIFGFLVKLLPPQSIDDQETHGEQVV